MEKSKNINLIMIWVGSDPPNNVQENVEAWKSQSTLNVNLITEVNEKRLLFDPILLRNRPWAQVADVLRISELAGTSGWYMDVDCEPGTKQLIDPKVTTLFRTEPNVLANGIFYIDRNETFRNVWMEQILRGLKFQDLSVADATGPGALTRAVYMYNYKFGIESSRNDLKLAKFRTFIHWPIQFELISRLLPNFIKRGTVATHYAFASWDEPTNELSINIGNLIKALLWKIRNSNSGELLNYIRFLISAKMPWTQRFSVTAFRSNRIIQASYLTNATTIQDVILPIYTEEQLILGVQELKFSYLLIPSNVSSGSLQSAGWRLRKITNAGELWERPILSKILGSETRIP